MSPANERLLVAVVDLIDAFRAGDLEVRDVHARLDSIRNLFERVPGQEGVEAALDLAESELEMVAYTRRAVDQARAATPCLQALRALIADLLADDLAACTRALVGYTIETLPDAIRSNLARQLAAVRSVTGGPTMIDIQVDQDAPRVDLVNGPITPTHLVLDEDGVCVGELMVWVTAGRISGLEFAWWSDDPPARMPPIARVFRP